MEYRNDIEKQTNGVCLDKNDLSLYNKLPKYAKKKVTLCTMNKTLDGWHCSIHFTDSEGKEHYIDEYGIGEFLSEIRGSKELFK